MKDSECLICGSSSRDLREFGRRGSERVELAKCRACGCEFLKPQPSDEWLAEEYRGYYEKRRSGSERAKRQFFADLLKDHLGDLSGKAVLELGAGEGDSVAAINDEWPSARVTAIESNPESLAHFSNLRCELVNQSVEQWLNSASSRKYDVVLLFDLLEHLRNPLDAVEKLQSRHVKSGGLLIATFPNSSSFSRKIMGRFWFQFKIEHLFYFSKRSVRVLSERGKLSTTRLAPLTKRLPVGYFLAVGSHFGPLPLQRIFKALRAVTPAVLQRLSVPLVLGEWLWIARKD